MASTPTPDSSDNSSTLQPNIARAWALWAGVNWKRAIRSRVIFIAREAMVLSGLESADSKYTVFLYSCFDPGSNAFFYFCYFAVSIQTDGACPSTRRNIVENAAWLS